MSPFPVVVRAFWWKTLARNAVPGAEASRPSYEDVDMQLPQGCSAGLYHGDDNPFLGRPRTLVCMFNANGLAGWLAQM